MSQRCLTGLMQRSNKTAMASAPSSPRLYRKGELGAEKPNLGVHTVGLPGGFLVRFPEALGA